jgi:hypothetical protein
MPAGGETLCAATIPMVAALLADARRGLWAIIPLREHRPRICSSSFRLSMVSGARAGMM